MDLEHDYRPFLIFGIICTLCATAVTLGGIGFVGVWMDALYPIIVLFGMTVFLQFLLLGTMMGTLLGGSQGLSSF
jgi:hypothetical protein